MKSLVRWDPFVDRISVNDAFDQLFENSFIRPGIGWLAPLHVADLAMDVYETKDEVVVKAAVPGIKPEDVDVTITGDVLSIRGEAKEEKEVKEENFLRKERRFGSFSRSVTLPSGLKSDKADARFENGILTLTIPKAEEIKPKVIKVKSV